MTTLLFLVCWFFIEFIIIYVHVCLIMSMLGDDAFLKNTPQELENKILYCICSCAIMSGIVGICFHMLACL